MGQYEVLKACVDSQGRGNTRRLISIKRVTPIITGWDEEMTDRSGRMVR